MANPTSSPDGKATGDVYSWGRGDDGRLGHGDNNWKYVPRHVKILGGERIVFVNCGSYHTAAVAGTLEVLMHLFSKTEYI